MSKFVVTPRGAELVFEHESPKPEEIHRQLQNILASPAFHGSKRCQQFLQYTCEKALCGESNSLKERMIAIDVFGRHPETDLGDDTIVRVGAREVRKRLAQYYVTPEGAASGVLIDLHPGSYVPEFRYMTVNKEKDSLAAALAVEEHRGRRWRIGVLAAVGLIFLAAVAFLAISRWTAPNPNVEAFNRFWEPVFRAPEPLLLAVAHPIVYHPSRRALKMSLERLPPTEFPMQRPIQLPPDALNGSDLVPVFNQYVGFGDMVVATEISSMLARNKKAVRVRMASSLEFADFRKEPSLLIGAITNRWTMELQPAWRFQFRWNPEVRNYILDTTPQSPREWSIPSKDDGSAEEDFFLICRTQNSVTGGLQLVAAGLKQFGTEAAGRVLADADQLGAILRKIPAGWESKNLQIVLHTRVIGNTPAQPDVIAWHVW
jgi:hypothetical protein